MDVTNNPYYIRLKELGVETWEKWNEKVGHKVQYNLLIAQPRSGSTLAIRLANLVCGTQVTGDRNDKFMRAFNLLIQDWMENPYQSGELHKEFLDRYIGIIPAYYYYQFVRLLWPHPNGGLTKLTSLHWSINDSSWLSNLRKFFESHDFAGELNIIFLTRDAENIARSLAIKSKEIGVDVDEELAYNLALLQQEKFKLEFRLGDKRITYNELTEDPINCLFKMKCKGYPNVTSVDQVLMNTLK
jgi:hypothetical protein